jgi:hypothetical protein
MAMACCSPARMCAQTQTRRRYLPSAAESPSQQSRRSPAQTKPWNIVNWQISEANVATVGAIATQNARRHPTWHAARGKAQNKQQATCRMQHTARTTELVSRRRGHRQAASHAAGLAMLISLSAPRQGGLCAGSEIEATDCNARQRTVAFCGCTQQPTERWCSATGMYPSASIRAISRTHAATQHNVKAAATDGSEAKARNIRQ